MLVQLDIIMTNLQTNEISYVLYKCNKNLRFSALVKTAIKSTETSSRDETQTECMHFNPYFSRVYSIAKVGIKMHALSSCFISAACFSTFYCSPY